MKRFWDKVNKTEDGCWEWQAAIRSKGTGYGCLKYNGKVIDAHRFAWYLYYGVFPTKWILHACDNRLCIRKEHLREGTGRENVKDAILRKRFHFAPVKPGEENRNAKLTEEQIREIRETYARGEMGCRLLAKRYLLALSTIQRIVNRESWKHI